MYKVGKSVMELIRELVNVRKSNTKKLKGSVKEPNMFHNYETEKIARKASDMAENLQL